MVTQEVLGGADRAFREDERFKCVDDDVRHLCEEELDVGDEDHYPQDVVHCGRSHTELKILGILFWVFYDIGRNQNETV